MGVKISNLPAIVTPALTDIFPVVQGGVTYKETFTQLSSLFATAGANSNITSMTGISSITFTPTTGGIVGTTTNDNAAAGYVGEVISGEILYASRTSITTATATNLFTINLTAGDWDLYGNVGVGATGAITSIYTGFSTVSATLPDNTYANLNALSGTNYTSIVPITRVSIASPTTYYLVMTSVFAGTGEKYGYYFARRRR